MSRLRELRLHGFKSFADPTRFVFEPGVNAVIGPNGSGKSNMADAIRWVLGEQSNRSLRTRRSDDVIFAGSEDRRPQGMAEAVLTLDNGDGWLPIEFAEVSIGRRSYRSGESEYLINGARARLRDVVDLLGEGRLGANELVVVGQGTVDAALSLRPEERRQLFEEAAGVKSLQVKRNEASGRLTKALDNLSRVTDIVGELKPQVRRLALQAEHQQQHDTLGARARALVSVSHRRREQASRAALGDARRAAAAAEAALEAFRAAQDAGREELAAAEARYWEAEEAAREAGRGREETRAVVIRAESRLEAAELRVRELTAAIERESEAIVAARELLASLDDGRADAAVAPALGEAAVAEEAWRAAVAALAQADDELLAAEEALAAVRARESDRIASAARAGEEAARLAARRDQLDADIRSARAERDAADDDHRRAVEALTAAEAGAGAAAATLETAVTERDAAQAAADEAQPRVVSLIERLRATRAELEALAEPHDAAARLGRRLADAGWPTLLDAIAAPEDAWPAIEAVVGGELEGALLWADGDPTRQISGARGAARILAATGEANGDGRAAALDAVRAERTLAEWVGATQAPLAFHRTAVAPDLDALLAGWRDLPAGWSAVTAAGDLADPRGVVVLRGRADPPGGAAVRAHARRRELADAVVTIERELAKAQATAHGAAEGGRPPRPARRRARGPRRDANDHERCDRAEGGRLGRPAGSPTGRGGGAHPPRRARRRARRGPGTVDRKTRRRRAGRDAGCGAAARAGPGRGTGGAGRSDHAHHRAVPSRAGRGAQRPGRGARRRPRGRPRRRVGARRRRSHPRRATRRTARAGARAGW